VNIIRYERFSGCIEKITKYTQNSPVNVLVFSVRPEPFIRAVKLYYRHSGAWSGKLKRSLNLAILKRNKSEKHDLLSMDEMYNPSDPTRVGSLRKALSDLNLLLGCLFRNDHFSLKRYLALIHDVNLLCNARDISLLVLGPPVRIRTPVEKYLSGRLHQFLSRSLDGLDGNYIIGSGPTDDDRPLFQENGIFANEKYHELIAERIEKRLISEVDRIISSSSSSPLLHTHTEAHL
jgi:hypothetical protein